MKKRKQEVEVPVVVEVVKVGSKLNESDDNTTELKNTYEQTIKDN